MDTLTTNALTTFIRQIAHSSNDEALLNTMFLGNTAMRGALYVSLMRDSESGRSMQAQYALERRVRAYQRQQYTKAMDIAAELNDVLALFAEQLLARVRAASSDATASVH